MNYCILLERNTSWRKREARLSNDGSIPRTNVATSLGVNRSGRWDIPFSLLSVNFELFNEGSKSQRWNNEDLKLYLLVS